MPICDECGEESEILCPDCNSEFEEEQANDEQCPVCKRNEAADRLIIAATGIDNHIQSELMCRPCLSTLMRRMTKQLEDAGMLGSFRNGKYSGCKEVTMAEKADKRDEAVGLEDKHISFRLSQDNTVSMHFDKRPTEHEIEILRDLLEQMQGICIYKTDRKGE